jgi:hypothetical protein
MKSLLALFILAFSAFNAQAAPCDKTLYHALCNPKLNLTESCYDCYRLDKNKERCVPVFNKLDLTDFMSSKKWKCEEHVWKNDFHSDDE